MRMLVEFNVPRQDLITIYILYIRSVLEQSCQVWRSSLSFENVTDLERVQKNALKIFVKGDYVSYEHALETVDLACLVERRDKLCLKFAKACLKNENVKNMFPLNDIPYHVDTREREAYKVTMARTERLKKSSVPYMQRLLNDNA